jgi:cytochrome c biogenesis protein CcmG, thiol:disulfide interchange protein DsbE
MLIIKPCHFRIFRMNKITFILIVLLSVKGICSSQESKKLPSVVLRSPDGQVFNTSVIGTLGKPAIIVFWATWCRPCIKELTAISDLYGEWKEKTGVVIFAISIDDSRTLFNVRPLIKSRGWEYEFYNDPNGDFKRAMGVVDIPHLFVLNSKGEIIHQKTSYLEGSEQDLFNLIQK